MIVPLIVLAAEMLRGVDINGPTAADTTQ